MQFGFVSAILPDLSLEQVFDFAANNDFSCVEVMCWPRGKAERRYAGVTHLDVTTLTKDEASKVNELIAALFANSPTHFSRSCKGRTAPAR